MSWAARRRFLILLIVGSIVAAFLFILSFATLYEAPTCTDSKQNQGEAGIDCGGPCAYLCTAQMQPPTVLYTKPIQNSEGRTDVIASVVNKNPSAAAKDVPYTVTLYGDRQALIQRVSGILDLPPGATVPVYVLGIASGKQIAQTAFLDIEPSAPQWVALTNDSRIVPTVSNIALHGTAGMPRIDAVLTNPSVQAQTDVQVVVIVHNTKGEVIAASKTVIPRLPAQGSETATFTWNNAFPDVPTAIEVVPIIPLP